MVSDFVILDPKSPMLEKDSVSLGDSLGESLGAGLLAIDDSMK
jgi:hypothetical protein